MIQRAVKQGRKVISYFVYLYVHHLDILQYPSKIFFSAFHRRVSAGELYLRRIVFAFLYLHLCICVFLYLCFCVFVFMYCTFGTMYVRVSLGEGPAGQLAEDPDYDRVTRGNNRIAH